MTDLRRNIYRIAAHTALDHRTVARVLEGKPTLDVARVAVAAAVRDLGIALPAPEHTAA